jgi:septum formation protein
VTRLILASASPRREALLRALVDEFEVVPSGVEEPWEDDPIANAVNLALAKARDVRSRNPGALVIGADTIVFDDARPYGKPEDEDDAVRMWQALGGRAHTVVTGLAVVSDSGEETAATVSTVQLSALDAAQVAAYVASGRPMDKAGAYAIQDEDVPTVAGLDGCYCAVMGLGLWDLKRLLAGAGVRCRPPSATFERCLDRCRAATRR